MPNSGSGDGMVGDEMSFPLKTGDIVSLGDLEQVQALVIDVWDADNLPPLDLVGADLQRDLIARDFRRVTTLGYRTGVENIPIAVILFEDRDGEWWNLHGDPVAIARCEQPDSQLSGASEWLKRETVSENAGNVKC